MQVADSGLPDGFSIPLKFGQPGRQLDPPESGGSAGPEDLVENCGKVFDAPIEPGTIKEKGGCAIHAQPDARQEFLADT